MLSVIFMDKFALGVFNIVFSLIFLSRGVSTSNLAFLMSVFSLIIVFLEVPSGVLSDIVGRKKTYLISRIVYIFALFIFCFSKMPVLVFGFIFYGIAQAFESGTIKALYFETNLEKYGESIIANASKKINFVQTMGLVLGVLFGGIIVDLKIDYFYLYSLNIFISILATCISLFLGMVKVKDKVSLSKDQLSIKFRLKKHIFESMKLFFNVRKMRVILIGTIFMGLLLFSIETYWQPRIQVITSYKNFHLYLMIISLISYFAATIGNFIGSYLLSKRSNADNALSIYYKFYILIFLSIVILAITEKPIFFLIAMFLIYTILGVMTICEDTILNINVPNKFRSTLMGLQSLLVQVGVIFSTQIAGFILMNNSIQFFWLIIATILLCSFIIIVISGRKR